jgi:hypothetical protein
MRDEAAEIVGVVGDVRHADVKAAPFPGLYLPRAQHATWLSCLLIRPAAGAQGVAASARAVIQSIDPEQPVQHITTLDRVVRESTGLVGAVRVADEDSVGNWPTRQVVPSPGAKGFDYYSGKDRVMADAPTPRRRASG